MNIIIMGLPGAGKGTQSENITKDYGLIHIATGDMFREAIQNETPLGLEAKSYTDQGDLVPDEVTNGIVKERLNQADAREAGFLLDGYPRTKAQANALNENLADLGESLDAVVFVDVDAEVLKERLSGRILCRGCGASFHKVFNPPTKENVCDHCQASDFYQREDDKPEKVAHRIKLQMDSIQPILDYYKKNGLLHTVEGDQAIDDVYQAIRKVLNQFKNN